MNYASEMRAYARRRSGQQTVDELVERIEKLERQNRAVLSTLDFLLLNVWGLYPQGSEARRELMDWRLNTNADGEAR